MFAYLIQKSKNLSKLAKTLNLINNTYRLLASN